MKARKAARRARGAAEAVPVEEEQRKRLIECCAFFRARRFRETMPGNYREQDLRAAAADIDSVVRRARRKSKP